MSEIDILKEWVKNSTNVVFFGGAGVSTGSGIPDFRSNDGLYAKGYEGEYSPEEIINENFFYAYPDKFYDYYWKHFIYEDAEPNKAHDVLAELEDLGHIKAIVTQNIDCLHQKAGSENVFEIHGSSDSYYCVNCGKSYNMEEAKECIIDESLIPKCDECNDILKPRVTLYDGMLDTIILNNAAMAIGEADVLIVGGTSLTVQPAASLVEQYRGKKFVIINNSVTPYDDDADLIIRDDIEKVLSELI